MTQDKFDIFISYRRKDENGKEWGTSIARNILQGLEDRGYRGRVFFDHNKIGPENFEKKILGAIKQAKVFLCILTKNAMDNCVNEGDWVRREICQAIESGLKIIFLNPDNEFNHKLLPKGLPKELEIVKTQNSLEIRSGQKFEVDMDDVVSTYISPIIQPNFVVQKRPVNSDNNIAIVRIKSDLDCRILNFDEEIGVVTAGKYATIQLPLGDNELKFVGIECENDYEELTLFLDNNHQRSIKINLLDKYNARKKAEHEAYLLSLPDDEFVCFVENGKHGYKLRSTGEIAIPAKFENGWHFSENFARVKYDGKFGFIDKLGNPVLDFQYEYLDNFSHGLAASNEQGKWGFIDKTGRIVIPYIYDDVWRYREGLSKVKRDDKWGFIDTKGKIVIPIEYDDIYWSFKDGLSRMEKNGKFGFINKGGEEIIPANYDYAYYQTEDLFLVSQLDKYFFINKNGISISAVRYDDAGFFNEGYAKVQRLNKWGFINKSGKEVIPCIYDDAYAFNENVALVELRGEWFYIDKNGERID